ncbi:MAG: hypothetical protein M3257_09800 [Actinomycetota bacterium]|nr:hypothetical protein [Actinomycetota bacterium]
MIVIDASVLVDALTDDTETGEAAAAAFAGRLQDRVWELRANLTAYDAAYIAAAEALGVTLLTGDQRLAAAPVAAAPS